MTRWTLDSALAHIGGLSTPDKMPCYSWSTPAYRCQLGALLRKIKGSTCSGCYALKGMYVMPCTVRAMERRWDALQLALASDEGGDAFVSAFAHVLNARERSTRKRIARGQVVAKDGRYFRWHDAGDVQSVPHLVLIARIAEATPTIEHWLPTREAGYVKDYHATQRKPTNLLIRTSLPHHDQLIPLALQGMPVSGVHTTSTPPEGETCIAYTQDGHCKDCRACWASDVPMISYPLH